MENFKLNTNNENSSLGLWPSIRRAIIGVLLVFNVMLLFGGNSINGRTFQWVGQYLAQFMEFIARQFGSVNGVGWAIIILTAIMRLILLPIMLDQQKKTTIQSVKMAKIQPQLLKIQEQMKSAATPEERMALQTSMMSLYRENGVSLTGGINFLSFLIQFPMLAGLYSAFLHADAIKSAAFFGITLKTPNFWFAIIAALLYLIQSFLMMRTMPEQTRRQMRVMMLISPLMIFFVSRGTSAALGLYFIVGGIFFIIQSFIIVIRRPKIVAQAERDMENNNIIDKAPKKTATEIQATEKDTKNR